MSPNRIPSEFDLLHDALGRERSNLGKIYEKGVGDILVMHDYYGHEEISVILLKCSQKVCL
jgi:hypothetical protein